MSIHRRVFALAAFAIFPALTLAAQCPVGTYQTIDQWGNAVCRDFGSGSNRTISGSLKQCPIGSYSTVDRWGNQICKEMTPAGDGAEYHDTSRGCPIGSYQTVDSWGNKTCKFF